MKKRIIIFSVVLFAIFTVEEARSQEVSQSNYRDFRELDDFRNYEKVTDTNFVVSGYEPTHRVTKLRKEGSFVILFSEISIDEFLNEHYRLLDTLTIDQLKEPYYISIGYCYRDDLHEEQVVAIVEKTEEEDIKNLVRAWKANTASEKFEAINDPEGIKCINEFWIIR